LAILPLSGTGVPSALQTGISREAYEFALTPSKETKYCYIGEIKFRSSYFDDEGHEHGLNITVPWTTIKETMALISRYAAFTQAGLKSEAARTAQPDGSQHDTKKLEEAKEIIKSLVGESEGSEPFYKDWSNIRRARSFLKENGE
jgi:hypothetical protein